MRITRSSQGIGLSDTEIRGLLEERIRRIGGEHPGFGIVVGVLEGQRRRIVSFGSIGRDDPRPPDGDTVFEIGSIAKVFTAILLADMIQKRELALDDSATKYLPNLANLVAGTGRKVTLIDLATHTSGLPLMPETESKANVSGGPEQEQELYKFVASHLSSSSPGSRWDYSNVGYWLLGKVLESRGGVSYQELLQTRVLDPLKLFQTGTILTDQMKMNLAPGHDAALELSPPITSIPFMSVMQPAGAGFVSTVNDLSILLGIAMEEVQSPLGLTIVSALNHRRPMSGGEQALGWRIVRDGSDTLVFHDGSTLGYTSAMGWDAGTKNGIVVLCNQATSISDIALHLLLPRLPLSHPASAGHTEITVDQNTLNS